MTASDVPDNSDWKWVYHAVSCNILHNSNKNLFLHPIICSPREMFSSSLFLPAKIKLAAAAPLIFENLEATKVEHKLQYIK